ncbi:unnamed protein product [Orchesella dallaii]|uniref:FAD-binding PCMH-type domain-containing protein n=1 Tax=Orchesella dallaii TaxID=48710 RepID=A0ABP1PI43_9HEXA
MLHFVSLASILFLGYPIYGTLASIPSTILEDVNCNKSSIYYAPETVQDLEFIFEVATAYNFTMKQLISPETVVKSSKSGLWNETNTNEVLVDTSNFNSFEYDKSSGYARVGAGLSLFNLTEKLHNLGRGLLCIPPQADVTVGAAILKGDHSSSLKYPTKFSHQIVGLVYLNKFGKLKNFTVTENSNFYEEHLLQTQFIGVIIELVIFTIPQFKITTRNDYKSESILWEDPKEFLNLVNTYDFFEFTWFPGSKEILVSTSEFTEINEPGNCKKHSSFDFTVEELVYIDEMLKAMQNSVLDVGMLFAQLRELKSMYQLDHNGSKVLCSPAVGYSHKMMMTQKENHAEIELPNRQEFRVTIPLNQFGNSLITMKEGLQGYPEANYQTGINFKFFGDFNKFSNLETPSVEISWKLIDLPIQAGNSLERKLGIEGNKAILNKLIYRHGGYQQEIQC